MSPRDMFFRYWGDNPFEGSRRSTALSTFSVDVDTAELRAGAPATARRAICREKAQIRTEEFVNYFKGDVPPPREGAFRVATELAPSLFSDSQRQLDAARRDARPRVHEAPAHSRSR